MKNEIPAAERIGQRFGRLVVIEVLPKRRILCQCDCGVVKNIQCSHVFWGGTLSCGCLLKEYRCTHRMSKTPEYKAWAAAKNRCYNPNDESYKNYGARGVTMYSEWVESFELFYDYIGKRPSPKHSLDRINTEGHYEPNNLRWATKKEQADNRRTSVWLEFDGKRMTITDWAEELKVTWSAIKKRLKQMDFPEIVAYYRSRRYQPRPNHLTKFLKQPIKK